VTRELVSLYASPTHADSDAVHAEHGLCGFVNGLPSFRARLSLAFAGILFVLVGIRLAIVVLAILVLKRNSCNGLRDEEEPCSNARYTAAFADLTWHLFARHRCARYGVHNVDFMVGEYSLQNAANHALIGSGRAGIG